MEVWEIFAIAVALGTDAFSLAIVIGIQQFNLRDILKISSIIALFHIFMPLLGLYGGHFLENLLTLYFNSSIEGVLNYVGAGLLLLIGFYMLIEQWLDREEQLNTMQLRGWGIIALSFSVSIDSFSVGVSLGMLDFTILSTVLIFGITAGVMMALGLFFGSRIGRWLGQKSQLIGGAALILLGLHFAGLII